MSRVYATEVPDPQTCAVLPKATGALMADPEHFDVLYAINPFMKPGSVDRARARTQWAALRHALGEAGLEVEVAPAVRGLPDLVFTANQSFPLRDGSRRVVLGCMAAPERQPEVAHIAAFWEARGYSTHTLPGNPRFEAGGDALWFPGRRLVLCGVGTRTERAALDGLASLAQAPVVALPLNSDRFYHLDTCLLPLDERCALVAEGAFSPPDLTRIFDLFPESVMVPADQAASSFACNGAVVKGRYLVHPGSPVAMEAATSRGLEVVVLDTGEFLKSGGSVTCLHMRF